MQTYQQYFGRWSPFWWLMLPFVVMPLVFVAGCQSDEITTYTAPRDESATAPHFRQRLIAVIFPQGENMWVVKLLGPEKQVEPLVGDFDKLAESIELSKDEAKPIAWKLPPGWSQLPGNKERFATLKSPGDDPLEVTISRPLPNSGLQPNVTRWRKQIGLTSPITDEQAEMFVKRITINGANALRVDLVGAVMTPTQAAPPPSAGPADKQDNSIKYKAPDGWKELPNGPFSIASFVIQMGDDKAKVTISPLPGQAGSLLDNVNRWRVELKLPKIDEDQLKKDLQADKVGGVEAVYVKLVGAKIATLGFIVKRGDMMWFFKMVGPKDLVEKQEADFKDFCHTVEFK